MGEIDVSSLLAQMRTLAAQAQSMNTPAFGTPVGETADKADFAALLENTIDTVNQTQQRAGALKQAFETGAPNVDLAEVMVSLAKADLSFKAMTEVRNKLVNAYQEIMNMPI